MDMQGRKKLTSVNYHRSTCGRFPIQSFPPPLPSMSCRDGPCIQMRPHRRDGHLIVQAVAVPPTNYLHAERRDGRLRLCFVESFSKLHKEDDGEDQMEEDLVIESENVNDCEVEVEVRMKNRGTVVEFNVSMQPPPVITGSPKAKVRRSSLVINKFLVGPRGLRRYLPGEAMEWKLQFTSKRRSREELLHDVQRCSDLRWPLFIFEQPCCIATTT
ncbi:Protein FANTASTIC FOUR 3 [Platanthera zijinensis]|uniref:Protein FANTASTIC FOUR 3 n=1 Tax=Platanthera zijinensis TaxID=2320716 RepID=A0AAP0BTX7_9ASPA